MTDDIVARLRIVGIAPGWDREDDVDVIDAAADEIERLRAAGDALYDALLAADMPSHDYVRVIDAWEEARRG